MLKRLSACQKIHGVQIIAFRCQKFVLVLNLLSFACYFVLLSMLCFCVYIVLCCYIIDCIEPSKFFEDIKIFDLFSKQISMINNWLFRPIKAICKAYINI